MMEGWGKKRDKRGGERKIEGGEESWKEGEGEEEMEKK